MKYDADKIKALKEISESATIGTRTNTEEKYTYFKDKRAFKILSDVKKEGALDPFNEYSYEWVADALPELIEHLENGEEIDEWDVMQHVENNAPVYTSDLLKWLTSRNDNVYYLTEAAEDGHTDGFMLLTAAHVKAHAETIYLMVEQVKNYLEKVKK